MNDQINRLRLGRELIREVRAQTRAVPLRACGRHHQQRDTGRRDSGCGQLSQA